MDKSKIFYKNILIQIFADHWERFKEFCGKEIPEYVDIAVKKMMECGLFKNGYYEYICSICLKKIKVGFTCKSRFCLRCSRVLLDKWLRNMSNYIFPWIGHRHVVLTVPKILWEYFRDIELREDLIRCGIKVVQEVAKIGYHNKDIEIGMIVVTQTAGRASRWNPHLHFLVTEGGIDKDGRWREGIYFDPNILNQEWMKLVLKMLEEKRPELKELIERIKERYKSSGFITRARKEVVRKKNIMAYLVKYIYSAPIALWRITKYDGRDVEYWYREHKSERPVAVKVNAYEFINNLIQHIVPRYFRVIRYVGLYSSREVKKVYKKLGEYFEKIKEVAREVKEVVVRLLTPTSWRDRIMASFKRDPLKCPDCGGDMELYRIVGKDEKVIWRLCGDDGY